MPKTSKKTAKVSIPSVISVPENVAVTVADYEELAENVAAGIVEVSEETKANLPPVVKGKDRYGFGTGSEVSFLASALESGNSTKTEILASFLARFAPNADDTGERKAKKTSFSVFFSDVKRPFGTYYASRSLVIVEGKDGKLSFDAKRADAVREAIGAGILSELRGVPKGSKRSKILTAYGLPTEG
jgi:hypothetical protein